MEVGSLLLGLALALVVVAFVVHPLRGNRADTDEADQTTGVSSLETLAVEHERVLTALRVLDFDHATGKLSDEDHAAQRARLLAEGASVLRQLDRLGGTPA